MSRKVVKDTIAIVGPTASGKTSLSIKLAKEYNGEIVSADSRAVYKYMDIGTAKPTKEEQSQVKHWGIDIVEPSDRFTAKDFQDYALDKIADIKSRGKVPFLVGGTGLYIDSVVYGYNFRSNLQRKDSRCLENMSVVELIKYCNTHNIKLPENYKNKRYLIRAIETGGQNDSDRKNMLPGYSVIGIYVDKKTLKDRIASRAETIFSSGIIEETSFLVGKYGFGSEAMKSNIYRVVDSLNSSAISLSEAKAWFIQLDLNLAKRQMTWFKRNPNIKWLPLVEAELYIRSLLDV